MLFSSLPGAERLQVMQAEGEPWCPKLYPLHEPVRARPLPVRPHPHLPQGRDVGDLHDETVLLAPLKPAGIARTRRVFFFFPLLLYSPSASPARSPGHANSLKSKVYEFYLLDSSFPCAAVASYCAAGKTPQCRFDRDSSFPGKHSPPGAAPGSL